MWAGKGPTSQKDLKKLIFFMAGRTHDCVCVCVPVCGSPASRAEREEERPWALA